MKLLQTETNLLLNEVSSKLWLVIPHKSRKNESWTKWLCPRDLSDSPPQPPYSLSPSVWALKRSKQITWSLLANYVVPTVYYASLECVTRIYNAERWRQTVVDQKLRGTVPNDGFLLNVLKTLLKRYPEYF